MYFLRVMPIQREWYYIDNQADREAVECGPNATPCTLIVFDGAYYCIGTNNYWKD